MSTTNPSIVRQAHDAVLEIYDKNPEDKWRVNAIFRCRLGQHGHDSTMHRFMVDIEKMIDKLSVGQPLAKVEKDDTIEAVETVKPTTPH